VTALLIDALSELGGLTITVRHELAPASQRLMDTLGVTVLVDPSAPECERFHDRTGERQRCRRCARVERERAAA